MKFIKKHPYLSSILLALLLGMAVAVFQMVKSAMEFGVGNVTEELVSMVALGIAAGVFVLYPLILTGLNLLFLFRYGKPWDGEVQEEKSALTGELIKKPVIDPWRRIGKNFEYITIVLGSIYTCLVLIFYEIQFQADWDVVLYNNQKHTPIFTQAYPTIIAIAAIGVLGYLILSFVPLLKMPPLVIVCSMSAMYLGIAVCVLWIIQLFPDVFLSLFPANCVIIAIKTVVYKIREWEEREHEARTYKNPFLNQCSHLLQKSKNWPFAAFLLMWPLLGIVICVLVLFGQQPDAVIKAWTETSDWNLSNRVAPQNLYYDEHYLCTVAAGGHPAVVKPIRLGIRHGHEVIVNRQLCIANAFEQILEEKTPHFHKHVRHFYDTYGFPIARLIHSPYIADLIYFLMKPLEWIFLIVLYFCDVHPENRIALQYFPVPEKWNKNVKNQ